MSDLKNYSGNPIDLSWQTAPWNRVGETIKKETENAEGNLTMTELPSEVNVDELTDLQETIIRTAVRNPELSTRQIEEIAGCAEGYSYTVLGENVPEWYENTFKQTGKSLDHSRDDQRDEREEYEYPDPDEPETVEESDTSHAHDYRDKTTDSPEWKQYALVALVGFVVGLLWGGRND